MTRDEQLRQGEERERQSAQIRERFGLTVGDGADRVTEWMTGAGAVPVALVALALVGYGLACLILGV